MSQEGPNQRVRLISSSGARAAHPGKRRSSVLSAAFSTSTQHEQLLAEHSADILNLLRALCSRTKFTPTKEVFILSTGDNWWGCTLGGNKSPRVRFMRTLMFICQHDTVVTGINRANGRKADTLKNGVSYFWTRLLQFQSHKTSRLVVWDEWLGGSEFVREPRTGSCAGVSSGKNPEAFLFFCAVGILHVFVKCLIKFDIWK